MHEQSGWGEHPTGKHPIAPTGYSGLNLLVMNAIQILPAPESTSAPLPTQSILPPRILVVDDDRDMRRLNTEVLLRSGYAVDAVADGAAGWEALNAEGYDLMITDNSMPKLSGLELLKKLRSARMELPVIMATGNPPTHEFAQSPWLVPEATLVKPYTIAELLRTVRNVLSETERTADAPPQSQMESVHRILVVDADPYNCHLSAEVLIQHGYRVDAAEDGAAGWEALQANPYSLLITDHDLPKLTGVELVRKLRAAHMDLPVVLAAGRLPAYQLARNPSLHFAATLSKPFSVTTLLDTVNEVLHATADDDGDQFPPRFTF